MKRILSISAATGASEEFCILPDEALSMCVVESSGDPAYSKLGGSTLVLLDSSGKVQEEYSRAEISNPSVIAKGIGGEIVAWQPSGDMLWAVSLGSEVARRMAGVSASAAYVSTAPKRETDDGVALCSITPDWVLIASPMKHRIFQCRNSAVKVVAGCGRAGMTISSRASEDMMDSPSGISYAGDSRSIIVSDTGNSIIRVMSAGSDGWATTSIVGSPKKPGNADGIFRQASFDRPGRMSTKGRRTILIDGKTSGLLRIVNWKGSSVSTIWRSQGRIIDADWSSGDRIFVMEST